MSSAMKAPLASNTTRARIQLFCSPNIPVYMINGMIGLTIHCWLTFGPLSSFVNEGRTGCIATSSSRGSVPSIPSPRKCPPTTNLGPPRTDTSPLPNIHLPSGETCCSGPPRILACGRSRPVAFRGSGQDHRNQEGVRFSVSRCGVNPLGLAALLLRLLFAVLMVLYCGSIHGASLLFTLQRVAGPSITRNVLGLFGSTSGHNRFHTRQKAFSDNNPRWYWRWRCAGGDANGGLHQRLVECCMPIPTHQRKLACAAPPAFSGYQPQYRTTTRDGKDSVLADA
ncbi:hypothetical protein N657DRAFT_286213 [Parathielavia appendiculata]|uniref:Uncharacterized protein n=1 Tax=Parathielavia appendiculata TaxID=2587402 RepID=A0AAN6Z631_9PEZI|nr:hypothetical protein N657DRAFT_286213 [Parathielavia appendiculata]